MSYEHFAYVYDELMSEAPYDQWCELASRYIDGKRVLDVGCGTGEIAIRLAQAGFDVQALDLSEDMLVVAQEKAQEAGVDVPFYQMDMTELDGFSALDGAVIFCDSLNYVIDEAAIEATFVHLYDVLKPGGTLLFDVHSEAKIAQFIREQRADASEDVSYIWTSFPGEHEAMVEHDLTFFLLDEESGTYDRVDERHIQRTFSETTYKQWLERAGFTIERTFYDFDETKQEGERLFFVAKRNS